MKCRLNRNLLKNNMKTITIKERPELKTSHLIALCKEKFNMWSYWNDKELDNEFPAPKEVTERIFLDSVEPDTETLGLSVEEAEKKGYKNGITIRERLIMELEYFEKTGEHLDVKGWTLCSGSRSSDGFVPGVCWHTDGQEVSVRWYGLGNSYATCGLRSAVLFSSLNPLSLYCECEKCPKCNKIIK